MPAAIASESPSLLASVTPAQRLVALAFDGPEHAEQGLRVALAMQELARLSIEDAVFVSAHGYTETADPAVAAAAVPSSLVGALVGSLVAGPLGFLVGGLVCGGGGALAAKLVDAGIKRADIERLQARVAPGEVVLALLVSDTGIERATDELERIPHATLLASRVAD